MDFLYPWGHKELDMTERLSLPLHVGPFMCNVTIDMLVCNTFLFVLYLLTSLHSFSY